MLDQIYQLVNLEIGRVENLVDPNQPLIELKIH